jgi:hypothetical protein
MRSFDHCTVLDHMAVETPISQSKNQKRWVSPEQIDDDDDDDDVSSVTSVDDSVSEGSKDDEYVLRTVTSLRHHCLRLLQDQEESR